MRRNIIKSVLIVFSVSIVTSGFAGKEKVAYAADENFISESLQDMENEDDAELLIEPHEGAETLIEQQEEKKENSWRFENGELIPGIETYAESSNAWKKVNGVYLNSVGNPIPGAVRKGIDVSYHQGKNGKIDWNKVKADGIDFVIIRCGYGDDYSYQDDVDWAYNVSECERLGIPYGVYIYSYATNTTMAKSEANHVLRLIRGRNLAYPVYFDMEDKTTVNTSAEMKGNMAKVFCDTISAAGYKVGIYANLNWWNTYLTSPVFDNSSWSKWVAQYNTTCDYGGYYDIWQCSDKGKVAGINGAVDLNFWMEVPYVDVSRQGWYYDAVRYMYESRIMTGLNSIKFGPSEKVSRAQFATILYRMAGSPQVSYSKVFPDVLANQFYTDAVLWASAAGITTGYENGRFGPADNITREQMMLMMYRYAKYNGYDVSTQGDHSQFRDGHTISSFAMEGVRWCVGAGVITGNDDGTLGPRAYTDRASVATVMTRYLE